MSDAVGRLATQIETLTDLLEDEFPGERRDDESVADAIARILLKEKVGKRPKTVSTTVRMPAELHERMVRSAAQVGQSTNTYVVRLVRDSLEGAP